MVDLTPAQAPFVLLKEICSLAVFGTPVQSEKQSNDYFQCYWTDDFPKAHVEIYHGASATATIAESSELHAFMIPWKLSENGRTRISFNANIGRTLAALLPERAALKERLDDEDFRRTLSGFVYAQIYPGWRRLGGNSNLKRPAVTLSTILIRATRWITNEKGLIECATYADPRRGPL